MNPPGFSQDYLRPDGLLDTLWRIYEDRPAGGLVQLVGPAGSGKSWAVCGLAREAGEAGVPVLFGRTGGLPELAVQAVNLGLNTRPAWLRSTSVTKPDRRSSAFLEGLVRGNRVARLLVLLDGSSPPPRPCPEGVTVILTGDAQVPRGRKLLLQPDAGWLGRLVERHLETSIAKAIVGRSGGLPLTASKLARGLACGLLPTENLPNPEDIFGTVLAAATPREIDAVLTGAASFEPPGPPPATPLLIYLLDADGRPRYPDLIRLLRNDPNWDEPLRRAHARLGRSNLCYGPLHLKRAGLAREAEVMRQDPAFRQACWEQAEAARQEGRAEEALRLFSHFEDLSETATRCSLLCESQRFEEALAVSRDLLEPARRSLAEGAFEMAPDLASLLQARGRALSVLGRDASPSFLEATKVLRDYLAAAELFGPEAQESALFQLAENLGDWGDHDLEGGRLSQAVNRFEEAARLLDTGGVPFLAAQIAPLARLGRWHEALERCEQALILEASGALAADAGDLYRRLACAELALERYAQAEALGALDEESRYHRARLLWSTGRQAEALTSLDERLGQVRAHLTGTAGSPTGDVVRPLWGTRALECRALQPTFLREAGTPGGPWLETCKRLAMAVADFFHREFPQAPELEVLPPRELDSGLTFVDLERAVDSDEFDALRSQLGLEFSASRADLVLCLPAVADAYAGGIGGDGVLVVKWAPDDATLETVAAHEFCHAVLELRHTDGWSDRDDPGSIMGPWGMRVPLSATYVNPRQKELCLTTLPAQHHADLACSHEADGAREQALRGYLRAAELDPNSLGVLHRAARLLVRLDRAEESLDVLRRLYGLDGTAQSAAMLGEVMLHLGRRREAEAVFLSVPGYGCCESAHLFLADACRRAACYGNARKQLTIALGLAPDHLYGLAALAWVHHQMGHPTRAQELYARVLEEAPNWSAVHLRQAFLLAQRGDFERASKHLESGKTHRQHAYFESLVLGERGDWAAALERLMQTEPAEDDASLHWHRQGYLGWMLGEGTAAQAAFEKSFDSHPIGVEGQASGAWLAWLAGEPEDALQRARRALQRWKREVSCRHLLRLAGTQTEESA